MNLTKLREKRVAGENGFTLIELLVVVVIIGILIAIAIPVYLNYKKGASDKSAQSDLRNAVNLLEQCNTDNAKYPSTSEFPATGGAFTGSCSAQKLVLSDGTTTNYASATPFSSYILRTTNTNGTGKVYCYNSTNGGAVKDVTGPLSTATC